MNKDDKRSIARTSFVILHDFPSSEIERAWRDCLRRVEFPAHYYSPEFFREPDWEGKSPFAILAVDRGLITGVLTGLHEGNQVISGLQSRPQICVDPTADTRVALDSLARGLLAEAGSAKLITAYSWSWLALDAFQPFGFRRRSLEGNVVLDLTKGPEILFKELNKKRRTNIRFAIRNDVEVFQATTPEHAAAFYDLYLRWRRTTRKIIRTERIPREVFESRIGRQENFKFFLARHSATVIAGITLRLFAGGLVEYANNSSLDEFLHLKPNDLLVWNAIEWACKQGYLRFSLGGAHRFLREFGGEVVPILRYRLDRTLFHKHELREAALDMARSSVSKVPQPLERIIRKILRKPSSR